MIEISEQQFIGSGGFSNVYRVRIANEVYALKKIHPYLLKDPSVKYAIMKEVEIMKQVDHPNIVRFHSCIQSNDYEINLVLQFVEGGNLYNQLKVHERFSEEKTVKYIKDILKALKYLHSRPNPILHRDIKPENILLTKSGQCKLADFGSSNLLDGQRNTFAGTQEYMAPQIIQNKPYGKQVDLWCLGLLIHELLLGQLPKQKQGFNFPSKLSRAAQDVIKRLLHKDPSLRMSLEELQNHIWLAQQTQSMAIIPIDSNKQKSNHFNQNKSIKQRLKNLNKINNQSKLLSLKARKTKSIKEQISQSQISKQTSKEFNNNKEKQNQQKYINQIKLKCQLKMKLQTNKQKLSSMINYKDLKTLREQNLQACRENIKEIEKSNKLVERKFPIKPIYEYESAIKSLTKKVDYLNQYVEYFPQKLIEQTTEMPQILTPTKSTTIQIDNYIMKLKNFTLQSQRNALLQLINARKRFKNFQTCG